MRVGGKAFFKEYPWQPLYFLELARPVPAANCRCRSSCSAESPTARPSRPRWPRDSSSSPWPARCCASRTWSTGCRRMHRPQVARASTATIAWRRSTWARTAIWQMATGRGRLMVQWIEDPIEERRTERSPTQPRPGRSVRELIDAVVRSEVDTDELDSVRGEVESPHRAAARPAVARLVRHRLGDVRGPAGLGQRGHRLAQCHRSAHGERMAGRWSVVGHATLRTAYEGPARSRSRRSRGALLLDQVMGEAAHAAERRGLDRVPEPELPESRRRWAGSGPKRRPQPPVPGEEHKTLVVGHAVLAVRRWRRDALHGGGRHVHPAARHPRADRTGGGR